MYLLYFVCSLIVSVRRLAREMFQRYFVVRSSCAVFVILTILKSLGYVSGELKRVSNLKLYGESDYTQNKRLNRRNIDHDPNTQEKDVELNDTRPTEGVYSHYTGNNSDSVEIIDFFPKEDNASIEDPGPSIELDIPLTSCETYNNCTKRKCISCSNTELDDCSDLSGKMFPVQECANKNDLCYSKHNPFGIITRGCFNTELNISHFVCSCNMCNNLHVQEMPFLFSEMSDWKENVMTIMRIRNFRSSIYKDIECIECEVWYNGSNHNLDAKSMDCLNGEIESNPYRRCKEDEMCGIKVIRQKYLWRGCLRYPVYNSWWTLCAEDFCNDDKIKLISDIELVED